MNLRDLSLAGYCLHLESASWNDGVSGGDSCDRENVMTSRSGLGGAGDVDCADVNEMSRIVPELP